MWPGDYQNSSALWSQTNPVWLPVPKLECPWVSHFLSLSFSSPSLKWGQHYLSHRVVISIESGIIKCSVFYIWYTVRTQSQSWWSFWYFWKSGFPAPVLHHPDLLPTPLLNAAIFLLLTLVHISILTSDKYFQIWHQLAWPECSTFPLVSWYFSFSSSFYSDISACRCPGKMLPASIISHPPPALAGPQISFFVNCPW